MEPEQMSVEEAAERLEHAYELAEAGAKLAYDKVMASHAAAIRIARDDLAEAHRRETIERVMLEVEKRFNRGV
ncbi:hypothetical protein ANANSI_80 [Arthrobacter phage Anansi]|uniref:Uncharacterized protein n=3 Tax=Amigovirus amigo TaxID=1982100 RepID=A0A0U4K1S3_9CAUD|nr:hypothetical protein ANANSI_80 [Arthrobacter phage Anansi]ALY09137.1 hypothetical protein GORGEOUS_80 [Arthrobacter phage Gorgeous]ALY10418.1 hypothetical protein SORJUANA_80 [Arthrobacter phage SorJuana]